MNVPLFVDARRPELERFLPLLFQSSHRRGGRTLYRRPSSGNVPISLSVKRFVRSLPKIAVRQRQPVLKFSRRKRRRVQIWSTRVRRKLLTEKQTSQLHVLSKRSASQKRRIRGGVKRRSMRRRQRSVRGVRLVSPHPPLQQPNVSSLRKEAQSPSLILPSHSWMSRRFRYRRDVVCLRGASQTAGAEPSCPPAAVPCASDAAAMVMAAQRRRSCGGGGDAVEHRLVVPAASNMKQFRRAVGATTTLWRPSMSLSRRPMYVGLLSDESHHHVYRLHIAAATAVDIPLCSRRLLVVSALQRAFGVQFSSTVGQQTDDAGVAAIRGVVMGSSGWADCDVHFPTLRDAVISAAAGGSEVGMEFLVVTSSTSSDLQAFHSRLRLSSTDPITVTCEAPSLTSTLAVQVHVSAIPTTLWDPRRSPAHSMVQGNHIGVPHQSRRDLQRTGLLCITCNPSAVDDIASSVGDVLAASVTSNTTTPPRLGVTVPIHVATSTMLEMSAACRRQVNGNVIHGGSIGAAGLAKLWIFVFNCGYHAEPLPTKSPSSSVMHRGGPQKTTDPATGVAVEKKEKASSRHADVEESVREAVFRASRRLFHRLLVADDFIKPTGSADEAPQKLVCVGCDELALVYRVHGVPSSINRDLSPPGFQWSATPSSLLPHWAPSQSAVRKSCSGIDRGTLCWDRFRLLQFAGKGTKLLMRRGDVVVSVEVVQPTSRRQQTSSDGDNGKTMSLRRAMKHCAHVRPIGVVTSSDTSCVFAGRRTATAFLWDVSRGSTPRQSTASTSEATTCVDAGITSIVVVMSAANARRLGVLGEWTSAHAGRSITRASVLKRRREGETIPTWLCDLDVCREVCMV